MTWSAEVGGVRSFSELWSVAMSRVVKSPLTLERGDIATIKFLFFKNFKNQKNCKNYKPAEIARVFHIRNPTDPFGTPIAKYPAATTNPNPPIGQMTIEMLNDEEKA